MTTNLDNELEELKRIGDKLPRAEWDFGRCPDERVYFARNYEYARKIPEIVELFRRAKERNQLDPDGTWHHVLVSGTPSLRVSGPDSPVEADNTCIEAIDAPPGFPDTPYLQTTHFITPESYHPFLVGEEPIRPVIVKKDGGYQANDWYHPDDLTPEQVSLFQINWRFTDHAILKSLAPLLEKMRGDRKPLERRGSSNEIAIHHADLKALGAVRLMEHFGNAARARDYTAMLGMGGGFGLYVNLSEWSEAKTRVKTIIEQWLKP